MIALARVGIFLRYLVAWAFTLVFGALACLLGLPLGPRRMWELCRRPWARATLWLVGVHVEVIGGDYLAAVAAPSLIVCNHQSLIDVVVLPAVLPSKVRMVAKSQIRWIPLWGWAFAAAGAVLIDRRRPRRAAAQLLRGFRALPAGYSLLVFPEGTRSLDGGLQAFRRGAFRLACQARCGVLPVALDGARDVVAPGAWLVQPGRVRVVVGPPLATDGWQPSTLAAHVGEARDAVAHCLAQARGTRAAAPRQASCALWLAACASVAGWGEASAAALEPGARGICRTVLVGDQREDIPIEVRGRLPGFLGPDEDLLLIRLLGDRADFTGVVAGMSGSPCWVDGELVGALSYALATFAKEPIAGVTPIASMRRLWSLPERAHGAPPAPTPIRPLPASLRQAAREVSWLRAAPAGWGGGNHGDLVPIALPVAVGGAGAGAAVAAAPWLRATQVGAKSVATRAPEPLAGGDAVAALLVRGAIDMAATGTVTEVQGDRVLAFGHPMMGTGAVRLPMARARIVHTLASLQRSSKLAAPGASVGEVTQDRLTGLAGRLGATPPMVPVRGEVVANGQRRGFAMEVVHDPVLTPRLVATSIAGALAGRVEEAGYGQLRLRARLHAAGAPPIALAAIFGGEQGEGTGLEAAVMIGRAVEILWHAGGEVPPPLGIWLEATLEPEPRWERVEEVVLARPAARPGESLGVRVALAGHRGGRSWVPVELPVPSAWAGERVVVAAMAAESLAAVEAKVWGPPPQRNGGDAAAWLRRQRPDGHLYVVALRAGASLALGPATLPLAPPSALVQVTPPWQQPSAGPVVAWCHPVERPGMLTGEARATVAVGPR